MSSNAGTENIKENNAFSEHINCDSVDAVKSLLESCRNNGYGLLSGQPHSLPPVPEKKTFRFLTLNGQTRIIEHFPSDQVISLETGILLSELQQLLDQSKQWFPVYSHDDNLSLMEFINSGDAGTLEHSFGEARDIVLGMGSVLGSGELIKCGGKVVKNVTGYDLPKLFCGSQGTLQVPVSAHLRLYAKPESSVSLIKFFKSESEAFAKSNEIIRSGLPISCLELADASMLKLVASKLPSLAKSLVDSSDPLANYSAASATPGSAVALCIQLHGMQSVIATLKKELTDLFLKDLIIELDESSELKFWRELSRPGQSREAFTISVCAPRKMLAEILKAASAFDNKIGWTARPSKYKASIEFKDLQSCLNFRKHLDEAAAKFSDGVIIAHPTDKLTYQVVHIPNEDMVLKELKRRIKLEYDPASIMNPLAAI